MIFQIIGPIAGEYSYAEGEGKDLGNIFTFESFKVNGVEASENMLVDILDGTTVNLDYTWDTILNMDESGEYVYKDVNPGDWSEIDIPEAFKLEKKWENIDIKIEGLDGKEQIVGKYSLIDNKIKFVFDDGIIGFEKIKSGVLGFGVKFNEEKFKEDVIEEIIFNDKSKKTITIIGKPTEIVSSISKKAVTDTTDSSVDPVTNIDATKIIWTIDIANPGEAEIKNSTIKDLIPDGLELKEDSVKVTNLSVGLDGRLNKNGDPYGVTPIIDKQEFKIEFESMNSYKGYRVEYITKIIDKGKTEFTNNAELSYGETKLPAQATISNITRSDPIVKSGKYVGENKIEWTIDVNKAGGSFVDASVEDILPAGLTLEKDSIEILKLSKDSNNKWIESTSDKTAIVFPVNLGKLELTDAYRIKFNTSINYSEVNGGTYQKENSFKNETILKDVDEEKSKADTTVKVTREDILSKIGKDNVNYDDKTMSWTITVDPIREAISQLTITDTFPNKGMRLLGENLEDKPEDELVVKLGDIVLKKDTDYTLAENTQDGITGYQKGFIIKFHDKYKTNPINSKITIIFKTSFDPGKGIDTHDNKEGLKIYRNNAYFTGETTNGKSIDENDDDKTKVIDASWNSGKKLGKLVSIDENGKTVDNWVSGNERKIQWEVYINYLKQNLGKGVIVTDAIGYEGKIDYDSIEVRKYKIKTKGDTELIEGEDGLLVKEGHYTVTFPEKEKEFELVFDSEFKVEERYVIIFTTSVPDISQKTYTNKATTMISDKEYPYEGSIGFANHNKHLSKDPVDSDGKKATLKNVYTDDEIIWNIKINESLSFIEKDVEIIDTISKGHVYKKDSLKVYKLNETKRGLPLVENTEYTLEENLITEGKDIGKTILKVKLNGSIDSTYEIEYATVVTAIDGTINNEVSYSGTNLDVTPIETKKMSASQFSYVGGKWDSNKGKIIINKLDADEKIINEEAEFEVYYMLNGEKRLVSGNTFTTKEGKIEVGNLTIGNTYFIKEISPPEGYGFDSEKEPIEVLVDRAPSSFDGPFQFDFKNKKRDTLINIYSPPTDPKEPKVPDGPKDPDDPTEPKDPEEDEELDKEDPGGKPDVDPEDPDEGLDGDNPGGRPSIPKLPTTGTKSSILLYGLGILSILTGILLRKKVKQRN